MSHLYYFYRLFPIRISAELVIPIRNSVDFLFVCLFVFFLRKVKFSKGGKFLKKLSCCVGGSITR